MVIDKVPTPDTKLMLWEEHPEMVGVLDSLFWEDQKVWYKCIDEKNEGIILEVAKPGRVQVKYRENKSDSDCNWSDVDSTETRREHSWSTSVSRLESSTFPSRSSLAVPRNVQF